MNNEKECFYFCFVSVLQKKKCYRLSALGLYCSCNFSVLNEPLTPPQLFIKGHSIWDPEGGGMENFANPPPHIFLFFWSPLHIFPLGALRKKGTKTVPPAYYCYKWYPLFKVLRFFLNNLVWIEKYEMCTKIVLLKRAPFFKTVPKGHCFGSVFFFQCWQHNVHHLSAKPTSYATRANNGGPVLRWAWSAPHHASPCHTMPYKFRCRNYGGDPAYACFLAGQAPLHSFYSLKTGSLMSQNAFHTRMVPLFFFSDGDSKLLHHKRTLPNI